MQVMAMKPDNPALNGKVHPLIFDPRKHSARELPQDPFWQDKSLRDMLKAFDNGEYDHIRFVSMSTKERLFGNCQGPYEFALRIFTATFKAHADRVLDRWGHVTHHSLLTYQIRNQLGIHANKKNDNNGKQGPLEVTVINRGSDELFRILLGININIKMKTQFTLHSPEVRKQSARLFQQWALGKIYTQHDLRLENPVDQAFWDILSRKHTIKVEKAKASGQASNMTTMKNNRYSAVMGWGATRGSPGRGIAYTSGEMDDEFVLGPKDFDTDNDDPFAESD